MVVVVSVFITLVSTVVTVVIVLTVVVVVAVPVAVLSHELVAEPRDREAGVVGCRSDEQLRSYPSL